MIINLKSPHILIFCLHLISCSLLHSLSHLLFHSSVSFSVPTPQIQTSTSVISSPSSSLFSPHSFLIPFISSHHGSSPAPKLCEWDTFVSCLQSQEMVAKCSSIWFSKQKMDADIKQKKKQISYFRSSAMRMFGISLGVIEGIILNYSRCYNNVNYYLRWKFRCQFTIKLYSNI